VTRLTDLVLRRRRIVAGAWLLLAIAGAWASSGLSGALSQSFDAPGRPAFEANDEIVERFGSGGVIAPIVAVIDGTDARDPAVARAFGRIADAVPGSRLAAGPQLVSDDGRTAAAIVLPPPGRPAPDENPEALAAARDAARDLRVGDARVQITGTEALATDSGDGEGIGLLVEILLGGVGALVVLVVVFASWLALVPLVVAAVSILTTFLLLRGLAELTDVSFVVQFLVGLIGLGVAIDYSLLVVVRWREERDRGAPEHEAVPRAMETAGRSVAVSGTTVAVGLLAIVVVPVPFIRSIGFGGLLIPLVSVLAALTLLPVVLETLGGRLDRRRRGRERDAGAGWTRWSRFVVRRRWPAATVGLAVLIALAVVATGLRPGQPSVDALSAGGEARTALTALEDSGLGAGTVTPIEVLSDAPEPTAARLGDVDGVRAVVAPDDAAWRDGERHALLALPNEDAASDAGRSTLDAVRDLSLPGRGVVGGPAAQDRDLTEAIYAAFPLMVALIALVTFALLARALRSVLLPLKAVLLNVLSVGAAFGVVVLVWQEGLGSELIGGVPATGATTTWVPLAIFAFLYGLSMDYEVFILSRMREEYDATGDTDEAVIRGLGRTGRLVTSAALILFLAFVALGAGPNTEIKILATGLAAGILLDATVVRALVVPALVTLFGRWNWWLPGRG
jgi:putative drug exporter of the RND superfamily